jgi:hypothetical protein
MSNAGERKLKARFVNVRFKPIDFAFGFSMTSPLWHELSGAAI